MQTEKPDHEPDVENPKQEEEKIVSVETDEEIPQEETGTETGAEESDKEERFPEATLAETAGETEGGEDRPDEAPIEPETERESGLRRFLHFLFSPETRVGRFMRPFLRITALVVGMFSIGLLVAFFTLYLPVRNQRDQALTEIQRIRLELENTRADLDQTQATLDGLQTNTDAEIADLEQENELANFKVNFLIAKNDVLRARLALLDEENGPGGPSALAALNDLENHLRDLTPYVEEIDPVLANLLQDRLKVVKGELVRDAQQAKVELESFYTNLLELEDTLFE